MTYKVGNVVRLLPMERFSHLEAVDREVTIDFVDPVMGTYTTADGLVFEDYEVQELVADWS